MENNVKEKLIMKDIVTLGEAMIVFDPESNGPLQFSDSFKRKVGGAELNFAIGCSRLGLESGWISALGKDPFGLQIRNFARGEGIDTSEVKFVEGYPTSLNFKEISESGNVNTYYYRDKSPTLTLTSETINEDYIKNSKILHLTGIYPAVNQELNLPLIKEAIKIAKKNNVLISFDPNIRLKLWSKSQARIVLKEIITEVDILMAGQEELEIIFGTKDSRKLINISKENNIKLLAIKKGEEGSVGYFNDEIVESPAFEVSKVVDTVGAGDGFNSGFIYGYLQGWSLNKMLTFANAVGSLVVQVKGDNEGLPYLEDVEILLGERELIER